MLADGCIVSKDKEDADWYVQWDLTVQEASALQSPKVQLASDRKDFRGNSDLHPINNFLCFASLAAAIFIVRRQEADKVPVQALLPSASGATLA